MARNWLVVGLNSCLPQSGCGVKRFKPYSSVIFKGLSGKCYILYKYSLRGFPTLITNRAETYSCTYCLENVTFCQQNVSKTEKCGCMRRKGLADAVCSWHFLSNYRAALITFCPTPEGIWEDVHLTVTHRRLNSY